MCPLETGLGSKFNETYFTEFKTAVEHITGKGGYVVVDPHNYMRTYNRGELAMIRTASI